MYYREVLMNKYIEDCEYRKRLNHKTIRAYKCDLNQFFQYVGLEYLNHVEIINYVHNLNQTYTKCKTIKRKIASIKSFFSYLEFTNQIEETPFRKIKTRIQEPKLLPKTIESETINKIFEYLYNEIKKAKTECEKNKAIRDVAVIELLFSTGLRISELCNIKINDIDLTKGDLRIFGKGSKERVLFVGNANVLDILRTYYNRNMNAINKVGYLFLNKSSNPLSDQSIRKLLITIKNELNLSTHITPHMYRHTFATMLLDKDVDIRYIQKILGHSSIITTQIYTHVSNTKQKEILTEKNPRNDYVNYI
ncbi:tyrosine-type recombinase/integrase [Amedibacillus sp. YH-ame10]